MYTLRSILYPPSDRFRALTLPLTMERADYPSPKAIGSGSAQFVGRLKSAEASHGEKESLSVAESDIEQQSRVFLG